MKARRSLFRVFSTLLILVAAITAAYGSQITNSEKLTVLNETRKNISETTAVVRQNLTDTVAAVALRDLEKEKIAMKKVTKIDLAVKGEEANKEKPVHQKTTYRKSVKTRKIVKVTKVTAPAIKTASGRTVSVQKSNSTKKLSREELILLKQKKAEQILAYYVSRYPILKGVRIYVRDCPNNWQGCAYYTKGIILVDPDHTAPLQKIIEHEVRHIIDWRTDNKIDYNDYHE